MESNQFLATMESERNDAPRAELPTIAVDPSSVVSYLPGGETAEDLQFMDALLLGHDTPFSYTSGLDRQVAGETMVVSGLTSAAPPPMGMVQHMQHQHHQQEQPQHHHQQQQQQQHHQHHHHQQQQIIYQQPMTLQLLQTTAAPPHHMAPPQTHTLGPAPTTSIGTQSYVSLPASVTTTAAPETGAKPQMAAIPVATASITPSPLTARLNYQFSQTHFQTPAIPATEGVVSERRRSGGPHTTTPETIDERKRALGETQEVSEDEGDKKRRRIDRNLREQQRSHRITEQIGHLKEVLSGANVNFKPDKYSTLVSVVEYIKQLQSRSDLLDGEHQKLLDTITKTNELVNTNYYKTSSSGEAYQDSNKLLSDGPEGSVLEDDHAIFVRDLDYKKIFEHCGIALAVSSIDGRFLDCNAEFETLTGYTRSELLLDEGVESSSSSRISADTGETQHESDTVSSSTTSCDNSYGPNTVTSGVPSTVTTSRGGATVQSGLSLFNLLARENMGQVFAAMSHMLKNPASHVQTAEESPSSLNENGDFWSGPVNQNRLKDIKIRMNVTLVRDSSGCPRFFQCALTPAD